MLPAFDPWTSTDGGALLAAVSRRCRFGMLLACCLGGRWLRARPRADAARFAGVAMSPRSGAGRTGRSSICSGDQAPPLGIASADGASVAMLPRGWRSRGLRHTGLFRQGRADFALAPARARVAQRRSPHCCCCSWCGACSAGYRRGDLFTLYRFCARRKLLNLLPACRWCRLGSAGGETLRAALACYVLLRASAVWRCTTRSAWCCSTAATASLDMPMLKLPCCRPEPISVCRAEALMTAGLLAKTALSPLRIWLPRRARHRRRAGRSERRCCRRW